jgi:hypothetical protein
VDCIKLAEDREKWRAVVDTVMNLQYTVNTRTRIRSEERRVGKECRP